MAVCIGDQIVNIGQDPEEAFSVSAKFKDQVRVLVDGHYMRVWKSQLVIVKIPAGSHGKIQYFRLDLTKPIVEKSQWDVRVPMPGNNVSMTVWANSSEHARRRVMGLLAKRMNQPVNHVVHMLGSSRPVITPTSVPAVPYN